MAGLPGPVSLDCDVLLRGGRVIDPATGFDAVADVAVADGRIVAVGQPVPGARKVVDVAGKVVAPGFIDLHSHAQTTASLRMQALDGVTTALELESGAGDVAAAYAEAEQAGRPINFGFSAGWAMARMRVLDGAVGDGGWQSFADGFAGRRWQQPASPDELARILGRIESEVAAGGLGIGVLVGYAPATGRREYFALAKLAAALGVPAYTHARFKNPDDPDTALEGIAEVVAAAAGTGAHMHVCHINSTSLRAIDEIAAVAEGARRAGIRLSTEAYPYGAGMTTIGAPFLDPANLPRLGIGPRNLTVVATGERPADDARLRQLRVADPGAFVIIHYLDEDLAADQEVLRRAVVLPDTAIASDAIPFVTPEGRVVDDQWPVPTASSSHPRSVGTFSRFFRTMVRESGAVGLVDGLRRASLIPAQILAQVAPQMNRKARIQVGCDADLVVFDAATIADRSTYAEPWTASTGIDHVLVGGTFVVRDGDLRTDALPGRPVRGAVA